MLTVTNLFDYFEEERAQEGEEGMWAARTPLRPDSRCDLKLMPRTPGWQDDPEVQSALERIEQEDWVAGVHLSPNCVDVRLDDDWIETVGAALQAGDGRYESLSNLATDRRFAVQFWDANATKALHAGHLRNLALGNAIASALTQAGADVERRSLISDVGRAMGEAMAGVVQCGRHTRSWTDEDEKSDHFVGECYAEYVKDSRTTSDEEAAPEDSLTRELTMRGDAADEWIKRVLAGQREALELWSKTRAWAIAGQRKTLARLGIHFDRVFFESDYLSEMTGLMDSGLREGRLRRREDGVVIYPTGHEDFDELPLVRRDGVPTQHMRALAYWLAAPDMQETTSMQICGIEWVSHVTYRRQLMAELMGETAPGMHPRHDIFHGMVARQKRALASSEEGALLIDELIDSIDAQIDADPKGAAVRERHPAPERLASQVALGWFLTKPVTPDVDFEPEKLLSEKGSTGWDLARARAHLSATIASEATSHGRPADDPTYRFAVVQSEIHRRHLRIAVERLDVAPLARYAAHLARWCLEDTLTPRAASVLDTMLERCGRGLGLEGAR